MGVFVEIEQIVCDAMGLDLSGIIDINKADYRTARKFVWYILYVEMHMKLSELSERYGRTTRAIRYGVSDISFGLRTQRYYKEIYSEIAHLRATKEGSA